MSVKARPLRPGGTIGVPAPASPYFNRSELLRGVEWWEGKGYNVVLGEGIHANRMYTAGDPATRARDVTALFANEAVDVIHCFQGGYGSAQTIPLIDWDVVRANPKPFVGYSDITALHVALRHFADLVTFYGPGVAGVGDHKTKEFTRKRLLQALSTTDPLGQVPTSPKDHYIRPLGEGRVSARMVGGCLWLIGQSIGTPWQPDLSGMIFFFEDVDCPAWYMDGLLNQMTQAGMLDEVVGVVVGELKDCDWRDSRPEWAQTLSIEDVLEQYIEPLGVPALYGFPMGHGDYLATTPLNVEVTLDADERTLTITEAALTE